MCRRPLTLKTPMPRTTSMIPAERIDHSIFLIRGQKVILDRDLSILYGVKPIALRQQVKRNRSRFPADFMLQLTFKEAQTLVSQSVIPSRRSLGGSLLYAFTQEGVAMLSSVLRSERAIAVNIEIMLAFVRLRQILASHTDLARRLDALERKYKKHDKQLLAVFEAIRRLMAPPHQPERAPMGFHVRPKD